MEAFAVRYVDALAEGAMPVRLGQVGIDAGVTPQTVSEWRNQTPGFNEWLKARVEAYIGHTWPAIKAVACRFALRGSIEHMKLLAAVLEPKSASPTGPGGADTPAHPFIGAVIINLPTPPGELNGHTLVRGLLDEAIDVTPKSGP